jgi:hypothetical protein
MEDNKAFPFRVRTIRRLNKQNVGRTVETLEAQQWIDFTLRDGSYNRITDADLNLQDIYVSSYEDTDNKAFAPVWGPFNKMHFYRENFELVSALIVNAELPNWVDYSDFSTMETVEQQLYLTNLFSAEYSSGVPYHAFRLQTTDDNAVRMTENTVHYAMGGSDGTMTPAVFATLVSREMQRFSDDNDELQDDAKYPFSNLFDSGFPLQVKYDLMRFISRRKDTAVAVCTHQFGGPELTASQDSSLAISLRSRMQMYPESEFFGTPTVRGYVVGRSGVMIGEKWNKRVPYALELAYNMARYMGAANRQWKSELSIDTAPNNEVSLLKDINAVWTGSRQKHRDWDNGLIWVEHSDVRTLYCPALKSVYDNDTSVLTSIPNVQICMELTKIGYRARRLFSGNSKLTRGQLADRIVEYVTDEVYATGNFDNRVLVKPEVTFTKADNARGYSWTLTIRVEMNNMMTVQTLIIEPHRKGEQDA